jgi:SAM-dependent methyltransferase
MDTKEIIFDNMLDAFAHFSYPFEKVFYFQHSWNKAREVFDLGCGNGAYTALLAQTYTDKHFTCAEINPALANIARGRAANNRTNIITGSYEDMPDDYKFDFLLARLVMTHIDIESFVEWADKHSSVDAAILIIDADIERFNFGPDLPLFSKLFETKSKENNFGTLKGLNEKTLQIFSGSSFLFNSTKLVSPQAYDKATKELLHTYMNCIAQLGAGTPLPKSLNDELSAWFENPRVKPELFLFGNTFIKQNNTSGLKSFDPVNSKKDTSKPIDCLHDFDDSIIKVFEICRQKISTYPEALRQTGLDFIDDYDIFNKNSKKNYISYLLPFWLQPYFSIDISDLIKLSVGNTFLMLCAIIQDDVMDAAPDRYDAGILPLGNLFFLDFFQYYRELFPSHSIIWKYLERYFAQWAESVTWEQRQHWNKLNDFTSSDMTFLAGKAAPLKISCAAACLSCGKEADLEPLCHKVDYIFILLQLLDDWADWKEDMSAGNCTFLLSEAMKYSHIDDLSLLTVSQFTNSVFFGNILEKVFSITDSINPDLIDKTDLCLPYLDAFIDVLVKEYNDIITEVQVEKSARLKGGFNYWLHKNVL